MKNDLLLKSYILTSLLATTAAMKRDLIYRRNPLYAKQRKLIEGMWRASKEEIECYQKNALNKLLVEAKREIPYYKSKIDQSLINQSDRCSEILRNAGFWIDKKIIRSDSEKFISQKFLISTQFKTSGTTGTGLKVKRSALSTNVEAAVIERHKKNTIGKYKKTASFIGRKIRPVDEKSIFWIDNFWNRQRIFSYWHISNENVEKYFIALVEWNPDLIQGYPSFISLFCRLCVQKNLDLRSVKVKAVFTGSEKLRNEWRAEIENAFGCRVYDVYGQSEGVLSISQCANGEYHIDEEVGVAIFEQEKILATGLHNNAMPLINYEITDDITFKSDEMCSCGRSHRRVYPPGGRIEDYVITKSGRYLGRLDHVFKANDKVSEAQFVQRKKGEVILKVVPVKSENNSVDDIKDELGKSLKEWFGSECDVIVEMVDFIPREKSGKLKFVKREINE